MDARVNKNEAKTAKKEAKEEAAKVFAEYEGWKKRFPHRSKEALMDHGKNVLIPVGEYYKAQFLEEGGNCRPMRVMAEAAQIFNPIFLAKQSTADIVTVLYDLADKLLVFKFRHFTKTFIKNLKKEMPGLVSAAQADHDLERIPPTRQYKTSLQERVQCLNTPEGVVIEWKLDASS